MRISTWTWIVCLSAVAAPGAAQEGAESAKRTADLWKAEQATIEKLIAGDAEAERRIVELMTADDDPRWQVGVGAALSVEPEERSPALIAGMIEALLRDVEWSHKQYAADLGVKKGRWEMSSHLARELAVTGNPAVLPAVAWRAAGPMAPILWEHGHAAVPHLLAVALSPRATGGEARDAVLVLASIVSTYGPGAYAEELIEAAALHLDGPPEGWMSAGKHRGGGFPSALEEAIALASVLRTPELTERIEAIAASTPEAIMAQTGYGIVIAKSGPPCARAHLEGTTLPRHFCDPRAWVDGLDNFPEFRERFREARRNKPGA